MDIYQQLPIRKEGYIRLLHIESTSAASPEVRCRLETASLNDLPRFYALSYTWGPPLPAYDEHASTEKNVSPSGLQVLHDGFEKEGQTASHPTIRQIYCNGQEMFVRENLHNFLLRCSHSANSDLRGPLWVDAICIDQKSNAERSHQVNLMAQIYRAASRVVVWLGAEDESTPKAFELIQGIALASTEARLEIQARATSRRSSNPLLDIDHWVALARFFERTWFSRAWIIQEVTLAQDIEVLCGTHIMVWEHLKAVSAFLARAAWRSFFQESDEFGTLSSIATRAYVMPARLGASRKALSSQSSDGMLNALIRSRHCTCQDARDKVYSQLSLGNATIFPSYTVSVAEAYIDTAKYILRQTDHLLLLTCVEGQEFQIVPGLPSWVPDWSFTGFTGLRVTGYGSYTAAGSLERKCEPKLQDNKQILSIRAKKFDDVVQTGPDKEELRLFANSASFWDIVSKLGDTYINGQSREEAVWRTLMTNREAAADMKLYPASEKMGSSFREWIVWRYVVASANTKDPPQLSALPTFSSSNSILPSQANILKAIERRKDGDFVASLAHGASLFDSHYLHAMLLRPFRTKQGYFGLGTQALHESDSVWIVPGCRVPLILREVENSVRYRLVGGAYVHGFMNGEALEHDVAEFEMVDLE